MSIGVENFSDEFLRRNKKGVTSQINQKAILAMQDLRKKRGDEGICYPTFYIPMTIDCDNKTTFKEFKEHYSLIKKLGLLELWEPNFMKYHPIRSWEEQEYLSRKDVHSGNENGRYDLEPFLLRDIIKNIEASPELHIVATGFKDDAMKERAEKLKRIFDPLVESI
jgi:hypothetical protein